MPPLKKGGPSNACRKCQAPVASHLSELRAIWVHPKSLSVRSFHHALQDYRSSLFVRKACSQHASSMAKDGWHMGSNHGDSTMASSNKACHKGIVSGQRNGRTLAWWIYLFRKDVTTSTTNPPPVVGENTRFRSQSCNHLIPRSLAKLQHATFNTPPKLPPGSPQKEPATNYSTIPRKLT